MEQKAPCQMFCIVFYLHNFFAILQQRDNIIVNLGTAVDQLLDFSKLEKKQGIIQINENMVRGMKETVDLNQPEKESVYNAYLVSTQIQLQQMASRGARMLRGKLQVPEVLEAMGYAVMKVVNAAKAQDTEERLEEEIELVAAEFAGYMASSVHRFLARVVLNEKATMELQAASAMCAKNRWKNRVLSLATIIVLQTPSDATVFAFEEDFAHYAPPSWLTYSDADTEELLQNYEGMKTGFFYS